MRYSRRLLDTLAFDFAARGLVGWCEWFAPSVCRYQERLTQLGVAPYGAFNQPPQYPQQHRTEWPNVPPHVCTLADYGSEAYLFHPKRAAEDHNLPATFGGSAPGRPGIPHITDTEANFAYSMAKPGQLFHSVKF